MVSNVKSKLLAICIAGMLGMSFFISIVPGVKSSNDIIVSTLTSHLPIRINNNFDLANNSTSGAGTIGDPYVIENLNINGTIAGCSIIIANTNQYLIIRNCTASICPVNSFIYILNVTNCIIFNNSYDLGLGFTGMFGIFIDSSSNITITQNYIIYPYYSGITVQYSTGSNINNNTIQWIDPSCTYMNESAGIILGISNCTVYDNIINYCGNGIRYILMYDAILFNNNISYNFGYGVMFDQFTTCSNNTLFGNIFINNTHQVYDGNLANHWNQSYPTGGNYYSDYSSYDNYSGAGQDVAGADGIGDESYAISGGSAVDYYPINLYPLIPSTPNNNTNLTEIGDIIFDMIPVIVIILFVVMIVTGVNKIYNRRR
jgi:parallel beta-helix repeat protein